MKHWIRDARYAYSYKNSVAFFYLLFHWLRVMGWKWLWECDGEVGPHDTDANHCDDGNMEEVGVTKWNAQGTGAIQKVTTPVSTGTQALEVVSSALNDGVRSNALLTMTNGVPYHVAIWAANNTGSSWDVQMDSGTGSFVSIGSIPDNGGVATLYVFNLMMHTSGLRYVQVLDDNNTQGTIYIDGIHVFRSMYEYQGGSTSLPVGGSDGIITNPNQFSTASSHTFVAGDVGKFICVYDPTNFANSGVYEISSVGAGAATLNLRSATHALISQTGLTYRMVDVANAPVDTTGTNHVAKTAGFGLESPHSSAWRFFMRADMGAGSVFKWCRLWSAPEDTDFDISTGTFYQTGPSTQNQRDTPYLYGDFANGHATLPVDNTTGTIGLFAMTEDNGDFLAVACRDTALSGYCVHFFLGYTGADADHPGIEEYIHASRWATAGATLGQEADWFQNDYRRNWMGSATGFSPQGKAVECRSGIDASYDHGLTTSWMDRPNAGPSPWSGEEFLRRVPIFRDWDGSEGCPSERDNLKGLYQGRQNLSDFTSFDSDNYFHIQKGTVWDWMGESL